MTLSQTNFWRASIATALFTAFSSPAFAGPTQDLTALLDAAASGDTIKTKPVDFGVVELNNYTFNPPVTLNFHKKSTMSRLKIRNVTGLTLDGLNIVAGESFNPGSENAVFIFGGGDITFRDASFEWADDADPLNDGTALVFDGVAGVTVEASTFRHVREGVIVRNSSDAVIQGSQFTSIFEDAIVVSGTDNVLIDDNYCADFSSVEGINPHRDCIQLQAGSRAVANMNVRITNNTILKGTGAKAQGIFVASRHVGVPHIGVTIEDNLIKQSIGLGIAATNANDLIIRGNQVLPSFEAEESPRIVVNEPAENVLIEGNTAAAISAPPDAIVRDNTILE